MKKSKTFPPISEIGDKYKEESFFKKQVNFKKKISFQGKISLFSKIKKYNKFYGTRFFITCKRLGESDLWEIENISQISGEKALHQIDTQPEVAKKELSSNVGRKIFKKMVDQLYLFDPLPFTKKGEALTFWNH
jgi:hypothetical protein